MKSRFRLKYLYSILYRYVIYLIIIGVEMVVK